MGHTQMRTDILTPLLIIIFLNEIVAMEIYADEGDTVTFDLPSVATCGNYKFLNPQLFPIIVIKNQSSAAIEAAYVKRTSVYVVDDKIVLTLNNVTPKDRGKYRVYAKSGAGISCSSLHHYLNIKEKQKEYLTDWSAWTECSPPCDPSVHRTRERNCSVAGGCKELGHRFETDSCRPEKKCFDWSQWSPWSNCSAVCGQGHRTRNRTCPATDTMFSSAICTGNSTQEEICTSKPCKENATFWTAWGPWGPCNLTCGGGYRQRTRRAKFPDSEIVASFAGWSSEEERCNDLECGTEALAADSVEVTSGPVAPAIIGSVVSLSIIVLLIVIFLLTLKLRKKNINVISLARSFRQSRKKGQNKPIGTPEIPRKASEPNAYIGVKVATPENDRKSKIHSKERRRKTGRSEIASSQILSVVDSLSYAKRPKSGKAKNKKKSSDNSNKIIRISAPIQEPQGQETPVVKVLYNTPRNSESEKEKVAKITIEDIDDTYEIPENPIWDDNSASNDAESPVVVVTDESSVIPSPFTIHKNRELMSAKHSFTDLSESCNSSPSSPGYAFKYPSLVGLSNLYDTPRSSSSNLAESIYDVPRNNGPVSEPVYVNENFHAEEENFYVTPKVSVTSICNDSVFQSD